MTDTTLLHGERMHVPERLIVAPSGGVFRPPDHGLRVEGEHLAAGDTIGMIESSGDATPVCSSFAGDLMGMLAETGQRLRPGEPIAWLRVT